MAHIEVDSSECPALIKPPSTPKEMLSMNKVDNQTRVRINSSSLSILQSCMRKAQYSLMWGLTLKYGSQATEFGSAIHAALETFYLGLKHERVIPPKFKQNIELMANGGSVQDEESFLLYRATRNFINRAESLAALPPTDKRSIQNGVWILGEYFTTYIDDPYSVLIDRDGPIVERRLEATLYETPELRIDLFGTIDVVLTNEKMNQVVVTDHKTTSQLGKDFFNRLKPNHQYTGYLWLAQECLGLTTDTFLVNGIEVKARPKTARGKGPSFPRQPTTRDTQDFEEFKSVVVWYVDQFLKAKESDMWPMGSVDSCAMWGSCRFLPVCSAPNALRENIIRHTFVENKNG